VIQYKYDAFRPGTAVFDVERGALDAIHPRVWQNDTSVSRNSWSYIEGHDYKGADELIAELVDVVSKNGVLLLNIGPKADGTIAEEEQELLRAIGRWLTVNGQAVYGTRPWKVAAEGPTEQRSGYFTDAASTSYTSRDIRFTHRTGLEGEFIYATALDWPADGELLVTSLSRTSGLAPDRIEDVRVLGHPARSAGRWTPTACGCSCRRNRPASTGSRSPSRSRPNSRVRVRPASTSDPGRCAGSGRSRRLLVSQRDGSRRVGQADRVTVWAADGTGSAVPRRDRTIPTATRAAAAAVRLSPEMVSAASNCPTWAALQLRVAMLPVKSAARMVPAAAMPIPVASSLEVSTRAAPTEVRSGGRPRSTLVPATTPTTRIPAATSTSETRTPR
jgi:hypothetical protein